VLFRDNKLDNDVKDIVCQYVAHPRRPRESERALGKSKQRGEIKETSLQLFLADLFPGAFNCSHPNLLPPEYTRMAIFLNVWGAGQLTSRYVQRPRRISLMAEHIRASVSPAPASGRVLNQYNWPGFCMACNEAGKVFSLLFLNSGQPVRVALK